jgi:hypothetical protein
MRRRSLQRFGIEAIVFLLTCVLVGLLVAFILVADRMHWGRYWGEIWSEAANWSVLLAWWFSSKALLIKTRLLLQAGDRNRDLGSFPGAPRQ